MSSVNENTGSKEPSNNLDQLREKRRPSSVYPQVPRSARRPSSVYNEVPGVSERVATIWNDSQKGIKEQSESKKES